jgi:hypothetical protein
MSAVNVDMHPGFFAGEEKEAKSAFIEDGRTHCLTFISTCSRIAVSIASKLTPFRAFNKPKRDLMLLLSISTTGGSGTTSNLAR